MDGQSFAPAGECNQGEEIREEAAMAAAEESTRLLQIEIETQRQLRSESVDLFKIDLTVLGLLLSVLAFRPGLLGETGLVFLGAGMIVTSIALSMYTYWTVDLQTGIAPESYELLMSERDGNVYQQIAEQHSKAIKYNTSSSSDLRSRLAYA
ncbi:hypothetical protein [Halobaculum limi]|uniref:hypothetical protein n=1 Tax=Halobaculum limi TaxID=3031916 RepID=UPI002405B578|nr:hypothetical protein [Halobaculum sp. YSMS11]